MTSEEFKNCTRGITSARLAELVGKSPASLASYLTGRVPVPADVALAAQKIFDFFAELEGQKGLVNMRKMKAIIDGKLYNTETATMIAEYSYGNGRHDFHGFDEELYQTRKGAFFLAGDGGPMTHYARRIDQNSCCGGEKITPLSEEEAREWLEQHGDAETYIAVFGKPEEA